jgi:hypothetical protein
MKTSFSAQVPPACEFGHNRERHGPKEKVIVPASPLSLLPSRFLQLVTRNPQLGCSLVSFAGDLKHTTSPGRTRPAPYGLTSRRSGS